MLLIFKVGKHTHEIMKQWSLPPPQGSNYGGAIMGYKAKIPQEAPQTPIFPYISSLAAGQGSNYGGGVLCH